MNVIQVGDVLERKHAFTDYKSLGFVYVPNFMYSEGVSPKSWLKFENYLEPMTIVMVIGS